MTNDYFEFEKLLFEYVSYIKEFNAFLTHRYQLSDLPYNVAGKAFARIGSVVINGDVVEYRFHGRGFTLFWKGLEIFSNVDATSIHQIIITPGGMQCFLQTRLGQAEKGKFLDQLDDMLDVFEEKGVFMKRLSSDLGTYHVNESWYAAYKNNTEFDGYNKDDIDWA